MNSYLNKIKNASLISELKILLNKYPNFRITSQMAERSFHSLMTRNFDKIDKNSAINKNFLDPKFSNRINHDTWGKMNFSFIKQIKMGFCTNLKSKKKEMIQTKITESKIKENLAKNKEEIEETIIENLGYRKSVYIIYLVIIGSVFAYSIIDYIKYPLGSKEATDAYCTMINSLNCANALGIGVVKGLEILSGNKAKNVIVKNALPIFLMFFLTTNFYYTDTSSQLFYITLFQSCFSLALYEAISKSSPFWFKNAIAGSTYLFIIITLIYIVFDTSAKSNLTKKKDKIENAFRVSESVIPKKSELNKFII